MLCRGRNVPTWLRLRARGAEKMISVVRYARDTLLGGRAGHPRILGDSKHPSCRCCWSSSFHSVILPVISVTIHLDDDGSFCRVARNEQFVATRSRSDVNHASRLGRCRDLAATYAVGAVAVTANSVSSSQGLTCATPRGRSL